MNYIGTLHADRWHTMLYFPSLGNRKEDMPTPRSGIFITVTRLKILLIGEDSCEWAAWFNAHYQRTGDEYVPTTFDAVSWNMEHTALMTRITEGFDSGGRAVFTERQNNFVLRGRVASLAGTPDLIVSGGEGNSLIIDAKTGNPRPSDSVQVMLYMWAVSQAMPRYRGVTFDGKLVYKDHELDIPNSAIDTAFINNVVELIQRVSTDIPARKVPSPMECGFCNITQTDCPERAAGGLIEEGETTAF